MFTFCNRNNKKIDIVFKPLKNRRGYVALHTQKYRDVLLSLGFETSLNSQEFEDLQRKLAGTDYRALWMSSHDDFEERHPMGSPIVLPW